jgi:hypothetical protein
MLGRDLPPRKRQRDGFRRRIPRTLPKALEPTAIQKLIDTAASYRDKHASCSVSREEQEQSAYNGHFESTCFHSMLVSTGKETVWRASCDRGT